MSSSKQIFFFKKFAGCYSQKIQRAAVVQALVFNLLNGCMTAAQILLR